MFRKHPFVKMFHNIYRSASILCVCEFSISTFVQLNSFETRSNIKSRSVQVFA